MAADETPRAALRRMLAEPEVLVLPGVYDALSASLVRRSGFRGAYMTGAGVSMSLIGFPDLGFTTMTEMAGQAARITAVLDIPLVADADTGFGNALSVQRTVAEYQRAGVAGLHIEDQEFPKRCGHLTGKSVIAAERVRREDPRRRRGPHRSRPRDHRPDRRPCAARLRRGHRPGQPRGGRRRRPDLRRGAAERGRDRPDPPGGRRAGHVQLGAGRPLARRHASSSSRSGATP